MSSGDLVNETELKDDDVWVIVVGVGGDSMRYLGEITGDHILVIAIYGMAHRPSSTGNHPENTKASVKCA